MSPIDRSIYDDFGSSVNFVDGCYEVELPWKSFHPTFPNNYQLCLSQLRGLPKRLKHDRDVPWEYNSVIEDQVCQGIVEVVEP